MTKVVQKPSPEKLAELGSLASGLVHELRNPLNAIRANLQLMEEDMERLEQEEGPHTRRVRRLLKEVGRLDTILSDFLAFVSEPEIRSDSTDLGELIQEVITLLTPQAEERGVVILSQLSENIRAEIDTEAIKQALMNLALNGIQAMEDPSTAGSNRTLMIRMEERKRDGRNGADVTITDTGCGIDPEIREHIFDLFFTTRDRGTGIGLAVVDRIIRSHGGTIQCESELGRGTSFHVWLPLERSDG